MGEMESNLVAQFRGVVLTTTPRRNRHDTFTVKGGDELRKYSVSHNVASMDRVVMQKT
jgi:hypothetical protein